MSENRTDVIVAFGVGLAAGAIAALLLTPYAGEETRRRLGGLAQELGGKARSGGDVAAGVLKEQVDRLGRAFEEGKRAYLGSGADKD